MGICVVDLVGNGCFVVGVWWIFLRIIFEVLYVVDLSIVDEVVRDFVILGIIVVIILSVFLKDYELVCFDDVF